MPNYDACMTMLPTSKSEAISAIRELASRDPRERNELSLLEQESLELALHIQKRTSLHDVPELVWHFLADADIRFKDPQYAQVQLAALNDVLEDWSSEPSFPRE
jgi:hypothetical protein